jgi:hypothetical protein
MVLDVVRRLIGFIVGFENNGSRGRDPSQRWARSLGGRERLRRALDRSEESIHFESLITINA